MKLKGPPAFRQAKEKMAKVTKRVEIEKAYKQRDHQIKRRKAS